jgi:class 3 adenylate cyclase
MMKPLDPISGANRAAARGRDDTRDLQPMPVRPRTQLTGWRLVAARIGWLALATPTLVLAAVGFLAAIQDPERVGPVAISRILISAGLPLTAGLFGILTPVFLAFSITALVLMWQSSDDWMVVLFSLALLLTGAYASRFAFTAQTVLPALHTPIMLLAGAWAVTLILALYLFPDGRFEPPMSAVVAILTLPLCLVFSDAAQFLVTMPAAADDLPPWHLGLVVAVLLGNSALVVAGHVYRYWRVSGPVERQQTKWVLVAFSALLLVVAALVCALVAGMPDELIAMDILLSSIPVLFMPIAVALAVLHRGLWNVDLVLNRTVLYGTVGIVLGASFLLASSGVQRVVEVQTGQRSDVLTLGLAVIVAVTFQPLRRRVAVLVDGVLPARQELALFFTDIVGSTEHLAEVGDARWRELLDQYRATVRRELRKQRGTEMHIAGDSFFATFADPLRAVRCAEALRTALRALSVPSRFGLHWGACEMRGEEVSGLAVWAAARIMGAAHEDEIVLSDAMRVVLEQTAGRRSSSLFELEDRGAHTLKGVPGEWRLHTLARSS